MGYNKEYYHQHRDEILKRQRSYYWKDPQRYRNYCKEYKRNNKEKAKERNKRYIESPSGIYQGLKKRGNRKISKQEFIKWYNIQIKQCVYCGILEKEIKGKKFKNLVMTRLQIDRKDNNKFYKKNNLVLACPICNFVKGDYFTYKEMLKIGKIITETIKNRAS